MVRSYTEPTIMKLKTIPEDFRVEELAQWDTDPKGDYSIYKVRKRKLTSFEAIDLIRKATELPGDAVTYAGLKDRQAVTTQYVAVKGRRIKTRIPGLHTTFVERCNSPLSSKNLLGNRFTIVVRDLGTVEANRYKKFGETWADLGLPNYFDDQRFGSIRAGQGFAAREIIRGQYEKALQRLIAIPGLYDPPAEVARKATIRRYWGQWRTIANKVRGSSSQPILQELARCPGDYRNALDRLPGRTRAVHLLAYQAYLWNEIVGRYLQDRFPPRNLCQSFYSCDRHIFWKECQKEHARTFQEFANLKLPMLNENTKSKDKLIQRAIERTLKAEGVPQKSLAMTRLKSAFFLEVERPLVLKPANFVISELGDDERNRGRKKLTLDFELPPGSYATLVLTRIFRTQNFDLDHVIERPWTHLPKFDETGKIIDDADEGDETEGTKKRTRPNKWKRLERKAREEKEGNEQAKSEKVKLGKRAKANAAKAKAKAKFDFFDKPKTDAPSTESDAPNPEATGTNKASATGPNAAEETAPGETAAEETAKKRNRKKPNPRKIKWKGLAARKERKATRDQNDKAAKNQKKSSKEGRSLRQQKRREKRKGRGS
jgi:tRNA pseudouridine13 synthase